MGKRSGFTLIELVVALLVSTFVMSALLTTMVDTARNDRAVQGMSDAEKGAREQLDTLVDHVRNAQQFKLDSDVSQPYRVIAAGAGDSLTYYTDMAGGSVRYYLANRELRRDATLIGEGETVVFTDVDSLEFAYYKVDSLDYYSGVVLCDDPHAPTASEIPDLARVDISVTTSVDGQPRNLFSQIRLRNSPRKERL